MKKLRNQNGLTLTEMLCTVIIVLLFSSLVAVGANAAVRSFRISMADSQAQELCSTLTTAISDKLRYCTVEADNTVFIQGVGYVNGAADKIFTADSGQVYLGGKKFLGAYAYPEGLKVRGLFSGKADQSGDELDSIVTTGYAGGYNAAFIKLLTADMGAQK